MKDPQADALMAQVSADMRQALKERDAIKAGALRALLARIHSAEAVSLSDDAHSVSSVNIAGARQGVGSTEVARRELSLEDVQQLVAKELDEIGEALDSLDPALPYALELQRKIAVIERYALPHK